MQRSARIMGLFTPGPEFQEVQNKLEAFRLFAYVDRELGFAGDRLEPLEALTGRALSLTAYRKIWALEGVSHYYTNRLRGRNIRQNVLAGADLPDCTMVPMHAGMGTSFAEGILAGLGSAPSRAKLRDAMERFFEVCRLNARPGWYENAIEPMGLAVRSLRPHLLTAASDAIGGIDADAQRLFWHGVGRSLYFVPMNFMTFGGAHERALRTAIAEAPSLEDRRNAVAGLVWAVTLVNIRHPEVLRRLLRASASMRMGDAVVNGIVSALMVWRHMVPEDTRFLPVYLRTSATLPIWNESVATPATRAFDSSFPEVVEQGRIATLFQYRAERQDEREKTTP